MNISIFLSGIYMACFVASGLFFLKFYKASGDRFFCLFSFACWGLALERVALLFIEGAFESVQSPQSKSESWVYLFRLAAFVIIVFAVIDRNRRRTSVK